MHGEVPDPVEEAASEGAAFNAVAQESRRAPAAIVLAAIAVLAVALLTKQPAPAATVATSGTPQQSLAAAPTSSAGPTIAPAASPTSVPPSRNPTVTPHPTFLAVPVEAGATQLIPAGRTPVRMTISLPDGWQKASDAMYVRANGVAPDGMSIGAWQLQHVNIFPCRWAAQEFADGPFMRTAEGQAMALSTWWGQDPNTGPYGNSEIAPIASRRNAMTIQGHSTWYLEVLIPSYLDHTDCDGGQLVLWDTASGAVRYSLGPGEIHRLWVMDVDSELIVLDAASFLAASPAVVTELKAVVDSIVIRSAGR